MTAITATAYQARKGTDMIDWFTTEQHVSMSPLWFFVILVVYTFLEPILGWPGAWLWRKTKGRFFADDDDELEP